MITEAIKKLIKEESWDRGHEFNDAEELAFQKGGEFGFMLAEKKMSIGAIAVEIAEDVTPKLSTQEQAMFVAGFQECIKYLNTKK